MSPGDDERRPGGGGGSSSGVSKRAQHTAVLPLAASATHVVTEAIEVTSATGRHRWLLPWRCSRCGATHVSQGRGELPQTVTRRGPHGPVVLHLPVAAVVA